MAGFNKLPEIIAALDNASGDLITELAKAIADQAKQNAPDDTGFMQSSIYYVTSKESTYGQGVTPPPEDSTLLPEIPKPDKVTEAYVAVGANYGAYQEFGTVTDAAQPYVTPAVDTVSADIESHVKKFEGFLKDHL